jgi:uncharacterized protein (DUF1778 family)
VSPKTGRPPKENPRKVSLNIRLTETEAKDIQECAAALGTSRTDAIMKGIELLKAEIKK